MANSAPLLTWVDFNPSMDKSNYIHYKVWDEITYPFQTSTVAVILTTFPFPWPSTFQGSESNDKAQTILGSSS